MPYDKKPVGGSGSDLQPVAGTNGKAGIAYTLDVLDLVSGGTGPATGIFISDILKEYPVVTPPITHFKLVPTGVAATTTVGSTFVALENIATSTAMNLAVAAAPSTICDLVGAVLVDLYFSTDGVTVETYYVQPFILVSDATGACAGP